MHLYLDFTGLIKITNFSTGNQKLFQYSTVFKFLFRYLNNTGTKVIPKIKCRCSAIKIRPYTETGTGYQKLFRYSIFGLPTNFCSHIKIIPTTIPNKKLHRRNTGSRKLIGSLKKCWNCCVFNRNQDSILNVGIINKTEIYQLHSGTCHIIETEKQKKPLFSKIPKRIEKPKPGFEK